MNIDLAKRDELPECLTTAQMNNAKAQFNPSSTANVSIKPYEIYDEDGVEQVIGEVRKTIDGVKKKKPLYKKSIIHSANFTSVSPFLNTTVDELMELSASVKNINGDFCVLKSNYIWGMQSDSFFQLYYSTLTDTLNWDGAKPQWLNGLNMVIMTSYTKTTDQWENIE